MKARKTQRERILDVLVAAKGDWVPLPTILDLKISQFGARIKEIRALGLQIENRTETIDGAVHSWYRLTLGVALPGQQPESTLPAMLPALSEGQPISSALDWETGRRR